MALVDVRVNAVLPKQIVEILRKNNARLTEDWIQHIRDSMSIVNARPPEETLVRGWDGTEMLRSEWIAECQQRIAEYEQDQTDLNALVGLLNQYIDGLKLDVV